MNNPFEIISKRLSNIESILLDIKHKPVEDLSNKLYSIKQTAEIFGVIPLTIRNQIKKGNIKAEKMGRKYFIRHAELFDSLGQVKSLKYRR